jgi:hypothetical protein
LEFLLGLTSALNDNLEKSLEKIWIAHVVIAGIGIATVFQVANVPDFLAHYVLKGKYDLATLAAIILAVHSYYFMKTGHTLTAFNEAKALRDALLRDYLRGQPEEGKVDPLYRTTSFLAAGFYSHLEGVVHFIFTALVVSLAQAAALFLGYKAYHADAVTVIVLCFIIPLYFLFWRAQADRRRATLAVLALWVFVGLWLIVFEEFAPGWPHE